MPHSVNLSPSKMSRPSSGSMSSTNVFPKQSGAQLLSPDVYENQSSPSPTTLQFSFPSSPNQIEENDNVSEMRPIKQGAQASRKNSRTRQQFFEDSFSYKEDSISTARDRVTNDAPIVVELRTNVIVQDEYTLVTDLSHHLSTRYQRPESSIMITVNHSACLLLGGSFEPTYLLTINALPSQVQTTVNKRNAALIQNFMAESIGVMPERGIIKFIPIQEDQLAIGGMTILGEIERLERQHAEESGVPVKRATIRNSRKGSMFGRKGSTVQLSRDNTNSSKANTNTRSVITPPLSEDGPLDSGVAVDKQGVISSVPAETVNRPMSSKKSEPYLSHFRKQSDPGVGAGDRGPRTLNKHKSFLNVFRR